MKLDLARLGFVIENEWYWKITENAQTFDVACAVRDFLAPLARYAKDKIALTDIAAEVDEVRFALKGEPVAFKITGGLRDRVAVSHFVGDLNHALSKLHYAFALVVPRRYELRGVLLTEEELASLAGDQQLLVPSARPSWRSIPTS